MLFLSDVHLHGNPHLNDIFANFIEEQLPSQLSTHVIVYVREICCCFVAVAENKLLKTCKPYIIICVDKK